MDTCDMEPGDSSAIFPPLGQLPGADPGALQRALREACEAQGFGVRAVTAHATRQGGRVVVVPTRGPLLVMTLDAETWSQELETLLPALVEAVAAVSE